MDQKQKLLEEVQADFQQLALINTYMKKFPDGPDHFSEQLLEKINKYQVLLTPGTDEYEKSEAMKGFVVVSMVEYNSNLYKHNLDKDKSKLVKDLQRLDHILIKTEPHKLTKNGFMVYFGALLGFVFVHGHLKNFELAKKYSEDARVLYNVFKACNPEFPTFINEFKGLNWSMANSKYFFDEIEYQIGYAFWRSYRDEPDVCPIQHVSSGIKHTMHMTKHGDDVAIALETIFEMIGTMVNRNYFKQVNHTLAVVWAFSVRARQKLSPGKRHTLDHAQGSIALLFAHWATKIWLMSVPNVWSMSNTILDMKLSCFEKNNDFFIPINDPEDEEYKQYLGQFPIEPVMDRAAMDKIVKKGIAWKERAKQMTKDPDCVNFKKVEEALLFIKNFLKNK